MDLGLTAQIRSGSGKGPARSLRREGSVPAIIYGSKREPLAISVQALELEKLLRSTGKESKLLRLTIEDGQDRQTRQVLIREIQVHPVRRRFLHVDFYEVPLDHAIVVEVPVELKGEPVGVKLGGVLDLLRRTVAVRCLPGDIPDKVTIDISGLEQGSTIHVADLVSQVPFELADDPSFAVVSVASPAGAAKETEAPEGEETQQG